MSTCPRPSLVELGLLILLAFSPLLCLSLVDALSASDNNVSSAMRIVGVVSIVFATATRNGRDWLRKNFRSLKGWHIVSTLMSPALLLAGASSVTLIEPWQAISFVSIVLGMALLGAVIVNVLWKQAL